MAFLFLWIIILMTYQESINYLYSSLPMFQRIGSAAYKPNLNNTIALCKAINNPERKFKSIHVAGTNGKGSSSHMLAAILQKAGYKTGLYTSPHLKEFTERIKVNGLEIEQDFVCGFVERIKPFIESLKPSFFEITVAMAVDYFAQQQVDIAVIEVGLGGRLDSTNVIIPIVSLITNISWDHKELLGDTLPKIASEKAGIIKHKVPVVVSERQNAVSQIFVDKAIQENAEITFATDLYQVNFEHDGFQILRNGLLFLDKVLPQLKGNYQQKNLAGVFCTVEVLNRVGLKIRLQDIKFGIENVINLTGLKGRWQKINEVPLTICDTGHNEAGVREVLNQISQQSFRKLNMVWGMVKDKDIIPILSLLPKEAMYYFCQATIPRALDADELMQKANSIGLTGTVIKDVNKAIAYAQINATPDDFIFIGGSTFVVAEIENL